MILAILAAGFILAGAASAQDVTQPVPPGADDSRHTFHRVGDSFVRLDGRTGYVSVCGREAAGWACRAVPDERVALEETIGRLQGDNAALKKECWRGGCRCRAASNPIRPRRRRAASDKPAESPSVKVPSDAELERVMGFIEKVWRRLVEMMVDLQRDMQRKS